MRHTLILTILMLAAPLPALAQTQTREQIPEALTWNPAEIYADEAAWRSAKDALAARLPELESFRGRLGSSAGALADALERSSRLGQELSRLYAYASLLSDQDTREAHAQGMRREMVTLASRFDAAAAYFEPEILALDAALVTRYADSEPRLHPYRHYLSDIRRRAEHTLTDREEKILAASGPLAGSPASIYNVLTNSDFPYPTVTLSDGTEQELSQARFAQLRGSPNRADREKVMSAFFGALGSFGNTFGTVMDGSIQKTLFEARTRGYETNLEMALDGPNIPVAVYARLVEGVNRHLPAFHRYLSLRKRMMGVEELHYYDLYAPLVSSVQLRYTPDEAEALILEAVRPLGPDYQAAMQRAFDQRWMDWFPTPGKRSGAYSSGAVYDLHPYVLLNYNGRYDDVSTVAHELGHAMHSWYSNRAQPYATARYPTFVAEVASTFNESLLIDHVLRTVTDPDVRLSLLGNYLENIKGTVFRQTQFAEFELRMHEMAQRGEPITGETLARLYLDITRKYYGHDQGVAVVDDYIAHEWSYIPHFYRDFYVFQYATSFTAAEALAQKVKSGDAAALQRYLAFLSSGGSKYPIDLLREAGVDMTSDEPLDLTVREMVRVMDEMERLLAQREG